jgi:hypothetical protein
MDKLSRRQYIKTITLTEYRNKRFTTNELTERFCRELFPGINPRESTRGTRLGNYFVEDPPPYKSVYRDVNDTLYSFKSKNIRYFFHSVIPISRPIWFHRDIATHDEIIRFASYLEDQGERLRQEATLIRNWALHRDESDNDVVVTQLAS